MRIPKEIGHRRQEKPERFLPAVCELDQDST